MEASLWPDNSSEGVDAQEDDVPVESKVARKMETSYTFTDAKRPALANSMSPEEAYGACAQHRASIVATEKLDSVDNIEQDVCEKRPLMNEPSSSVCEQPKEDDDLEPMSKRARIEGTPPRNPQRESHVVAMASPSILQDSWKHNTEKKKIGIGENHQVSSLPSVGTEDYSSEGGEVLWDCRAAQESNTSSQKMHGFLSQSHELSIRSMLLEALHKANYDTDLAKKIYFQLYGKHFDLKGFNPPVELSFEQFEALEEAFKGIREENFNLKQLVQAATNKCSLFLLPNYHFDAISRAVQVPKDAVLIYYYNAGRLSREATRKSQAELKVKDIVKEQKKEDNDYCTVCDDGGKLIICDSCDHSYHLKCHDPPLAAVPTGDWVCSRCLPKVDYSPLEVEYIPLNESKEYPVLHAMPIERSKQPRTSEISTSSFDTTLNEESIESKIDHAEEDTIDYSTTNEEHIPLHGSKQAVADQLAGLSVKQSPDSAKSPLGEFQGYHEPDLARDIHEGEVLPAIVNDNIPLTESHSPASHSEDVVATGSSTQDDIVHGGIGSSSIEESQQPRQDNFQPIDGQHACSEEDTNFTEPSTASLISISSQPGATAAETGKAG